MNSLRSLDVSEYIFKPKAVSNIVDSNSEELYEKFFEKMKMKYNEGQFSAIKNVCLSSKGISIIQGPVIKRYKFKSDYFIARNRQNTYTDWYCVRSLPLS